MESPVQLEVIGPQGHQQQTIRVSRDLQDARLTELLRRAGLSLNTRCGQHGLCDGCNVELVGGTLVRCATGEQVQIENGQQVRTVRACEYRMPPQSGGTTRIVIPPRSLLAYEPQVVSEFKTNVPRAHDPLWQCLTIAPEDLPAEQRTLGGIAAAVARRLDLHELPRIDAPVRQAGVPGGTIHATVEYRGDHWLLTALSATPPAPPLGVAIDVGTTTVAILLVDLSSGKVVGSAAGFNRQMHLGDDVLTRINLCCTDKAMLPRLQQAVVNDTIQKLLLRALKMAGASDSQIACLTVGANTTMLHLLAGVDPSPMGISPFTPAFVDHRVVPASAVHLRLSSSVGSGPLAVGSEDGADGTEDDVAVLKNGHAEAVNAADPVFHLLPSAAAYIGADLTAGIFASGLVYDDGPSLLVDVGTNGEIILKHGDKLLGCATAAGPAFEGSRLACGMRAGAGALSRIRMSAHPFSVETEVIGGVRPTGICGSAYVDFLAQARKAAIIGPTGRFETGGIADDHLVQHGDCGLAFRVAWGHGKEPIVVAESDIASLLQAKAAIAAGILTLLNRVGLAPEQVKTLYLAGGFGMHMDIRNAIGCGLLPGFRPEQIQLVGNTSLAGAYLALLDSGVMDELTRIARSLEAVELNLDPDFESRYIDQLWLPD